MNPDLPKTPKLDLEERLTALLLGELTEVEATALRDWVATNPEAGRAMERLQQVVTLLREAQSAKAGEAPAETLRLSDSRRGALLQQFKTVQPAVFRQPVPQRRSQLLPISIAAAFFIMVLGAIVLPALSRAKSGSMAFSALHAQRGVGWLNRDSGVSMASKGLATNSADQEVFRRRYGLAAPSDANAPASPPSAMPTPANEVPKLAKDSAMLGFAFKTQGSEGDQGADTGEAQGLPSAGGVVTVSGASGELPPVAPVTMPPGPSGSAGVTLQVNGYVNVDRGGVQAGDRSKSASEVGDEVSGLVAKSDPVGAATATRAITESEGTKLAYGRMELDGLTAGKPLEGRAGGRIDGLLTSGLRNGVSAASNKQLSAGGMGGGGAGGGGGITGQMNNNSMAVNGGNRGQLFDTPAPSKPVSMGRPVSERFEQEKKKAEAVKEQPVVGVAALPAYAGQAAVIRELRELSQSLDKVRSEVRLTEDRKVPAQAGEPAAAMAKRVPLAVLPETVTAEQPMSTFSLNVSDVSFKLAEAGLESGVLPDPAGIRSEEFINAFDYHDADPAVGVPISFAWERARYPFAQNRDVLRFSIRTAAQGRAAGIPLNVVLLLDNSGSMERADRVRIIREGLRVLAAQLKPQDKLSVVTFARTARLWVDGVPGDQAGAALGKVASLRPEGGTNLEEALRAGYETARRHFQTGGINRVVILTDGAANLGEVSPATLRKLVEEQRRQGIALDCFGIGWEGYNDDLLESLSRNGDGRYGFINTPEAAAGDFAGQLAGALRVAASDVKVQVEFNPARVRLFRQVGYVRHQLTKEQFRDNTVDAAELGAAESGTALYVIEPLPQGSGPLAKVRVRYKVPGTTDYREQEWVVGWIGNAPPLSLAPPSLRLAASAGAFSEWLAMSPFAGDVTPDRLLPLLQGVPETYGTDPKPGRLESMIRQAKSISGK